MIQINENRKSWRIVYRSLFGLAEVSVLHPKAATGTTPFSVASADRVYSVVATRVGRSFRLHKRSGARRVRLRRLWSLIGSMAIALCYIAGLLSALYPLVITFIRWVGTE